MIRREQYIRKGIIFGVVLLVCIAALGMYKLDAIYAYLSEVRRWIVDLVYDHDEVPRMEQIMKEKRCNIDSLEPMEDEEGAWYTKYHFIAHAGGGIEGRIYTNSLEAWEHSYERGLRIFDADLCFTEDKKLVLRHSWADNLETNEVEMSNSNFQRDKNGSIQYTMNKEIMKYSEFMQTKIFYKYTPMDCKEMIHFMQEHNDLYVACDVKGNDVIEAYQYFVNLAFEEDAEEILSRVIIGLYDDADYDIYDDILEYYDFKNVIAKQYYGSPHNYYVLAKFCLENDIHVVNISACFIQDEELEIFRSKGIHIFVSMADYISDLQLYREIGGGRRSGNKLA